MKLLLKLFIVYCLTVGSIYYGWNYSKSSQEDITRRDVTIHPPAVIDSEPKRWPTRVIEVHASRERMIRAHTNKTYSSDVLSSLRRAKSDTRIGLADGRYLHVYPLAKGRFKTILSPYVVESKIDHTPLLSGIYRYRN